MKISSSLRSAKNRGRHCKIVRRRNRLYVIDPISKRHKRRQGGIKKKVARV